MKYFVIVKNGIARIMAAIDSVNDAAEVVAKWHPDDQAQVTSTHPISIEDIPQHRGFRDAWRWNRDGRIEISMPVARDIHMARVRQARDDHPDWASIDADRARAVEDNDDPLMTNVKARANVLRDLPAEIKGQVDAATTAETLHAIWPGALPPR